MDKQQYISNLHEDFMRVVDSYLTAIAYFLTQPRTTTHDSLAEASTFVEVIEKRQGLKVACLEGIAYRNGWISEEKMRELAKPMLKNQYGQYLLKVIDEMKEEVNSGTLNHV